MIFALALTGPTASGKTALSLDIAERLGCEIISCDSMQVYREMNIGTAKATEEQRRRVKHHLIDFLHPSVSYSAENYRADALAVAREITARGKIPLFVGGTGLYINAVKRGAALESPPSDPALREKLLGEIKTEEDVDRLWQRLREVDPESAERIHKNNLRRVARALEIYILTGRTKTEFDRESEAQTSEVVLGHITLDFHNRENLYSRVDERVLQMERIGLLDEVRSLSERGLLSAEYTSAQAIGYKELLSVVRGESELLPALEELKTASRRYAKRQLTWFRADKEARRLFVDGEDGRMKNYEDLSREATELARGLMTEYKEKL